MPKIYTSFVKLQADMEKRINIAVMETAKEVKNMLYGCIQSQYYEDPEFQPNIYVRTEEFLNSAAMSMLSPTTAQVFIDGDGMHYKTGINPWQVIDWASQSMHGGEMYQTETEDFWSKFTDWCETSLLSLLRANLKKAGLSPTS